MIYKVSVRETDLKDTVRAKNELEARAKFCEDRGLLYRVFANKLEVEEKKPSRSK